MTNKDNPRALTDQELEAVSGGGYGQAVAEANHLSGHGPGYFAEPGGGPQATSTVVHLAQGK